jgi:hypothetical protein
MKMASNTRFVVVTPGRVAYTSPNLKEQFTSNPKSVLWTPYLQELLTVHGDIRVVNPAAYLAEQKELKASSPAPAPVARPPRSPVARLPSAPTQAN